MHETPQRQSKSAQNRIIDGAKRFNELGNLYWFVNAFIPGYHYSDKKAKVQPAMFPRRMVPVICMGADEVASRHYADTVRELFALVNLGRGFEFSVEITDIHELEAGNWQWYEWGATWDCVCAICGGIFSDTCPQLDVCADCAQEDSRRMEIEVQAVQRPVSYKQKMLAI